MNIWEVAIKSKLGKFDIVGVDSQGLYQDLIDGGYDELPVISNHCFALENLTLITHDNKILQYDRVKTLKTE